MDDQNKNLIFATVLSFHSHLGWFVLFPPQGNRNPSSEPYRCQTSDANAFRGCVPATLGRASITCEDSASTTKALDTSARIAVERPVSLALYRCLGSGGLICLPKGYITQRLRKGRRLPSGCYLLQDPLTLLRALAGWGSWARGILTPSKSGPNTFWSQSDGETLSDRIPPVTLIWDN